METNDDYSHALTRLLAGERGYVFADDLLQDDLRAELASPNPDLAAYRAYLTARVTISQEHARRPASRCRPPRRPPPAAGRGRHRAALRSRHRAEGRAPAAAAPPRPLDPRRRPRRGHRVRLPLLRPGPSRWARGALLPELRPEPARAALRRVQRRPRARLEVLRGVRPAGRVLIGRGRAHEVAPVGRAALRGALVAALSFTALARRRLRAPRSCPARHARLKWPLRTREHVDLWLHGFAMISSDSLAGSALPARLPGALTTARAKADAVTDLDVNHDALARRLRENPALHNAEFLVLSFPKWDELVATIDAFVKADGDPRKAKSKESAAAFTALARLFPARADREFARTLTNSLQDEKKYSSTRGGWTKCAAAIARSRPSIPSGNANSTQAAGFPHALRPAGRRPDPVARDRRRGTGRDDARERAQVAVGFPDSPDHAMDAIYAFVHEIVGPLTGPAVDDNTTPAEKRSGVATVIGSFALVRGGALVLAHFSPELAAGYARFYCASRASHSTAIRWPPSPGVPHPRADARVDRPAGLHLFRRDLSGDRPRANPPGGASARSRARRSNACSRAPPSCRRRRRQRRIRRDDRRPARRARKGSRAVG